MDTRRRLKLARLRLLRRLSYTQLPFRLLLSLRPRRRTRLPRRDTRIVIDGFPRSGNTFSVCAFQMDNGSDEPLSHHLHAPGQIVWAARRGLPVIMLIRDPDEVALSEGVRKRGLPLSEILTWYRDFYVSLLPYRDHVVVGEFSRVTTSFDDVIEEVNAKYGTTFRCQPFTDEDTERAFRIIDEAVRRKMDTEDIEAWVARPSETRDQMKASLREELESATLAGVRRQAHEAFARWTSRGDAAPASHAVRGGGNRP